ncbi:MAG TPA: hypothetical protein VMB66_04535 [Candidatus Acidoferrales bacterium]|nr:hypothetical protein [Candidatus Acidoferrales bacterium]
MTAAGVQANPWPRKAPGGAMSPMAYLLHALNQPLTALQCSMELAVGARPAKECVQVLRDGLEFVGRMRALVEALRELTDIEQEQHDIESVPLEALLRNAAQDLSPVAQEKEVSIYISATDPMLVWAERRRLEAMLLRFLEAALSLATANSALRIAAERQEGRARLTFSWHPRSGQPSPFSHPELGILIVQAAWEHMGGHWTRLTRSGVETCLIEIPLAKPLAQPAPSGELK